jgi:hypothetical protein
MSKDKNKINRNIKIKMPPPHYTLFYTFASVKEHILEQEKIRFIQYAVYVSYFLGGRGVAVERRAPRTNG